MRLALHLEGRQSVVFRDTSDLEAVLNGQKHSRLTRWFRANEKFPSAHCIMYTNFPDKFEWDKSRHEFFSERKAEGSWYHDWPCLFQSWNRVRVCRVGSGSGLDSDLESGSGSKLIS